jgi:hypothetical protein
VFAPKGENRDFPPLETPNAKSNRKADLYIFVFHPKTGRESLF